MNEFRLCYVSDSFAYFADTKPTAVTGDDWNDAPHDCNAGTPYADRGYRVVVVAYDGDLEIVGTNNRDRWGYLSADDINAGPAPWLYDPGYGDTYPEPKSIVRAGVTLEEFKQLVAAARGHVYEAAK